jgi:adenosylcobinamide-phosphate guanylyltransferase
MIYDSMIAAIMCGGKGNRMRQFVDVEKPMLKIKGKPMIERVLDALVESQMFERIIGVPSPNTPKTSAFLHCYLPSLIDIIKTKGRSYSKDLSVVLNKVKPAVVFVVAADIPLLNPKIVQNVIRRCSSQLPCVSIISEKQFVDNIGMKSGLVLTIKSKQYCHTGITVIDSSRVKGVCNLKEYYVIMNEKEIAVNVNTGGELDVAKRLV